MCPDLVKDILRYYKNTVKTMSTFHKYLLTVSFATVTLMGGLIFSGCDRDNVTLPNTEVSNGKLIMLSTDDPENPVLDEEEVSELSFSADVDTDDIAVFPLLEDEQGTFYQENGEKIYISDNGASAEPLTRSTSTKSFTTPAKRGYVYTKIKFPQGADYSSVSAWVKINFGSWYSGERQASPSWYRDTFVVRSTHRYADRVTYKIRTNGRIIDGPWHSSKSDDWRCGLGCVKYKW